MRWPLALPSLVLLAAMVPIPAVAEDALPSLYFTTEEATGPGGDLPSCSGNAYALGPQVPAEDGKAYHGASTSALACTVYFVHTVAEPFALAGDATAHFFTACDTPVVVGTPVTVTYRVQLRKNAETIAQVDADGGFAACDGPDTVTEMDVGGIDTDGTAFAPGDTLTVAIVVWTSGASESEAASFHYLVGPTRPSRLMAAGLPGGAGATGPTFTAGNLTGPAANVTQAFGNQTSAVHQYSWATNLTAAEATVNATVANGTASVRVVDGNGTEVLNETFNATADSTFAIPVAAPGNWSIVVAYDNFTGNLSLRIGAPPPPPVETNTTSETSTTTAEATGSFPLRRVDKGAPGPGIPLLLAAAAATALLVRRRL